MAALAVADTDRLLEAMDVAGALDLEAFAANLTLLHPAIAQVRPYPGLAESLAACESCSREARSGSPGRRGTSRIRSPSAASRSCTEPCGTRSRSRAASSRSS